MAVAAAVARAFAANRGEKIGDFWVDLTRMCLYVLLPFSLVIALTFVALGEPQTLAAHATATTVEGAKQTIALFPVASQEAIKQLGTNGGGIFNANSAHPFENPNPITNLIEIVEMNVLGFACVIAFGRVVLARKDARALLAVMVILLSAGAATIYWSETQPAPALAAAHADTSVNMEGKEVRFGAPSTAVFTAATTGASDGGVIAMHDSMMPLGGGMALFLIQLGEIIPGGVGSGLYGMVVMALIAVFVAGLMVGRTPEYLGKKVEAREIKYAMLAVLILPLTILGFTAIAAVLPVALKGLENSGPHGLSEILYAYSSAAGNNGSAFAGLTANTPWWNTTLGVAMLLGRFAYAIPVLAIAGSIAAKPKLEPSAGTLPTHGPLFIGLLVGVILIMGGLQFFPRSRPRSDRRALPGAERDRRPLILQEASRHDIRNTSPGRPAPVLRRRRGLLARHPWPGDQERLLQARPAQARRQPGDPDHRGGGRPRHPVGRRRLPDPRAAVVRGADRRLALGHGAVRQLRREHRRGAGQGRRRRPARHAGGHQGQADRRPRHRHHGPPPPPTSWRWAT